MRVRSPAGGSAPAVLAKEAHQRRFVKPRRGQPLGTRSPYSIWLALGRCPCYGSEASPR